MMIVGRLSKQFIQRGSSIGSGVGSLSSSSSSSSLYSFTNYNNNTNTKWYSTTTTSTTSTTNTATTTTTTTAATLTRHQTINEFKRNLSSISGHKTVNGPKYITTPIFYVNASPHIGHLYTALLADAACRWNKLKGFPTFLVTGTDEHGTKVQEAAKKNNQNTLQYCDSISSTFKQLFELANIEMNDYIRTTQDRHKKSVHCIWDQLIKSGHIYKGRYEGWYCTSDEAFLTEEQIEDKVINEKTKETIKVSKESGNPVVFTVEENYMFKLSAFKEQIKEWLVATPNPITPASRVSQVLNALDGLRDLSVSRPSSRVEWGIRVPGDDSQTIYVWLDALTNYLTVAGYPNQTDPLSVWNYNVEHLIGKDIIKFHTVYWVAFLSAIGAKLPSRVVAHAHWTVERVKMSKSLGNVIDPFKTIEQFGVDPIRYFLLRCGGMENDGDFSTLEVISKLNNDLADTYGNLVSRSSSGSLLPTNTFPTRPSDNDLLPIDKDLINSINNLKGHIEDKFDRYDFKGGLEDIIEFLYTVNKYFVEIAPWTLVPKPGKKAGDLVRLNNVMYIIFESIRVSTLLLSSIIPQSAVKVLDHLSIPPKDRSFDQLFYGYQYTTDKKEVNSTLVLFNKFIKDDEMIASPPINSQKKKNK
ncbi:methionyl-tRNA synthetase [Cavenderia fasciculata]|uniref:methionine--tRNA ligase n=1 Tax=Cavenderia fasciculata TaxID=261658 RepID=F4Q4T6_CACFS|nr:methionyl-tRNA synthetase [Cavenderia fasciculata]EGG17882.1 methionyl-tRNA synthetase [Cavenderia fasciculata]|eukprot:XP_004356366.1 methionyl-tRNA synthetase [Cavenderia fasciculata]